MFPSPMPKDAFAEIVRQLYEVVSELQETLHHEARQTLLRHMWLLLLEAHRALDESPSDPSSVEDG